MTRLLGQSPAGLSATGDSDTRNYYDMIAARQELDLRPQLERLDRLMLRPDALAFAFRPLWQLEAPARAALALSKAQTTQIYAGLGLWLAEVTARLVEAQLVADGTYPNAAAVFAEGGARAEGASPTLDFDPDQPRDKDGRWTAGGGEAGTAETSPGTLLDPVPPRDPVGTMPNPESPFPGRQEQGEPTDLIALDPVEEAITRQAVVTLAPLLAASRLRQRALEVVRGLVQNLSSWLTLGLPPDPPPSAQPAGSRARASAPSKGPLPRPLTIHGGSPQLGPDGERYSFSEQAGDPPAAGSSGKTLGDIDIPSDLTIPVKGGTPTQEATEYEASVRNALGFDPAPVDYKPGGKMPDGVMISRICSKIALEVKYFSADERALRDPDRNVRNCSRGRAAVQAGTAIGWPRRVRRMASMARTERRRAVSMTDLMLA